ncbi:hypothetical protein [Streptomyces sp. NPDC048606]|uniref:hypothetical protein n=1 Tax=Streptomyces sp. NPDC048606 TaxID=3154726 RepID=UPI003442D647
MSPEGRLVGESLTRRKTTLAALSFPTGDEEFLAKLQRVQDATARPAAASGNNGSMRAHCASVNGTTGPTIR